MKNAKVIIVEKNAVFMNVVKSFLENETCCEIIGLSHEPESISQIKNLHLADIIFYDIDSDLEAYKSFELSMSLLTTYPQLNLIAISSCETKLLKELLQDIGFKGLVLKSNFYNDVVPVLEQVLHEDAFKIFIND